MDFEKAYNFVKDIYSKFDVALQFIAHSGENFYKMDADSFGVVCISGTRVRNEEGVDFIASIPDLSSLGPVALKEYSSLDWKLEKPAEMLTKTQETLFELTETLEDLYEDLNSEIAPHYYKKMPFLNYAFQAAVQLSENASDTQYITNLPENSVKDKTKYFIPFIPFAEYPEYSKYKCYAFKDGRVEEVAEIQVDWSDEDDPEVMEATTEAGKKVTDTFYWDIVDGNYVRNLTGFELNY